MKKYLRIGSLVRIDTGKTRESYAKVIKDWLVDDENFKYMCMLEKSNGEKFLWYRDRIFFDNGRFVLDIVKSSHGEKTKADVVDP